MRQPAEQFPNDSGNFFLPHEAYSPDYGTRLQPRQPYILRAAQPLYDTPSAQYEWGVNGSILGIVSLPQQPKQEPLQMALVDYGPAAGPGSIAVPLSIRRDQPIPQIFGYAQSRFGLQTLNSVTKTSWPIRYVPLPETEAGYTVGRSDNPNNRELEISDGHTVISRAHFSVEVASEAITLVDRSTNGTWLRAAYTTFYPQQ